MAEISVDSSRPVLYVGGMANLSDYTWARIHYLEELEGYDPTYDIIHHAEWCGCEDGGWMFVLRRDGQLYLQMHINAAGAYDNTPHWRPMPITEDEALQVMMEWEDHEDLPDPGR